MAQDGLACKLCQRSLGKEQNGPPCEQRSSCLQLSHRTLHFPSLISVYWSQCSWFWVFLFSGLIRTEAAFSLPQHMTEREGLKPQLRLLLSHFNIPYDVEELRDATKEMELFNLVLDGLFLNTKIGVRERKHYCLPQSWIFMLPQLFLE